MTKSDALLVTAYTGTLFCDFADFHKFAEARLGRTIFTHEMGFTLFWDEMKRNVSDDVLTMIKSVCCDQPPNAQHQRAGPPAG